MLNRELLHDPEASVLGMYFKELKTGNEIYIFTSMFITALFTIAQR